MLKTDWNVHYVVAYDSIFILKRLSIIIPANFLLLSVINLIQPREKARPHEALGEGYNRQAILLHRPEKYLPPSRA